MYRYIDLFNLKTTLDDSSIQQIEDLFRLDVELFSVVDNLSKSVCVGRIPSFYTIHVEGIKSYNIYGSLYRGAFDKEHEGTCNLEHPTHSVLTKEKTVEEFYKYVKKLDNYNIKKLLSKLLPDNCYSEIEIARYYKKMNTKYKMYYLNNLLFYLSTIYRICMYLKVYYLRLVEHNCILTSKDALKYYRYFSGSYAELLTHINQLLYLTKKHRENIDMLRLAKFNKIVESFKMEQF